MKHSKHILLLVFCCCWAGSSSLFAQKTPVKQDTNGITIIEDERIAKLVQTHIGTQPRGVPGYRVQVFFTAKKAIALDKKTIFMEKFPEFIAEVDYDDPHFKVVAGAFRFRIQADKLLRLVREEFPGSFIVTDNIPPAQLEQ
ncbi:MAG: SPOR domain-containing protein [Flavobacteriales bacterium]|nr:SPOR domain-containing protein [Flavobacteriales bacterium]